MKTRSAKNKGKRLQNYVRDCFRQQFKDILEDGDIESITMGEAGCDIKLSPYAKKLIPFDIECKNQQNISFWQAIEQAEKNSSDDRIPMVIFKRNRSKEYCMLRFNDLLKLLYNKNINDENRKEE